MECLGRQVAVIVESNRSFDRRAVHGIASFVHDSNPRWSLYVEDDPRVKIPDWKKWHGDGIIANFDDQKVAESVAKIDLPVVGLGRRCGRFDGQMPSACVAIDECHIALLAFTHLFELGFRSFAFCGERASRDNGWSMNRETAYRDLASEAGCRCDVFRIRHTARQWTTLQERLQRWLRSLTAPVGLLASDDSRARHVLEACRGIGARVPDDLAVIGVDNDSVLCDLTDPPLTSIEPGAHPIGFCAAELLHKMMSGDKLERRCIAIKAGRLVARQSTDVLAVADDDLASALRFIREHACDPIQVDDVLAEVPLSRTTLESRFRQLLGTSIHAEIRRVQVGHAKQLLAETNLPLPVVAHRVGVSTVQYFTTLMRRETGNTPAKIRRHARTRFRRRIE